MVNEHSLLQISYIYLELSYSMLYAINNFPYECSVTDIQLFQY